MIVSGAAAGEAAGDAVAADDAGDPAVLSAPVNVQ